MIAPLSPALRRTKQVLFQPFEIGKWFVIGFCAWLARLGETGVGGNFRSGSWNTDGNNVRHEFERAREYVVENLHWILPLAVALLVIGFALWVVLLWLNSRGKFMFLRCVARNEAAVVQPWPEYAREGNSLFRLRLVIGLAGWLVTLPSLAAIAVAIYRMLDRGQVMGSGVLTVVGVVLLMVTAGFCLMIIAKLLRDFAVPIMYLRRNRCLEACGELRALLASQPGQFVLYFLFSFVLMIGIAIGIVAVVILTCCCAGCLMAIPYIGTVLLLPVSVFTRSYSLYFLAQFGPRYDVFDPSSASGLSAGGIPPG